MVDFNVGLGIISSVFRVIIVGFGILIVCGIIAGIGAYVIWKRKFDIKVRLISSRSGEKYRNIFDRGAVLTNNKDGHKYLRLYKTKRELPYPPFNILQLSNEGDYVEIWRRGEDDFVYLNPASINKTEGISARDGSRYVFGEQEHKQIHSDIRFWNIKKKEKIKNLFAEDSLLMKLLPYVPIMLGGIILIFVLYILFTTLPAVLTSLRELVDALKEYNDQGKITIKYILGILK